MQELLMGFTREYVGIENDMTNGTVSSFYQRSCMVNSYKL